FILGVRAFTSLRVNNFTAYSHLPSAISLSLYDFTATLYQSSPVRGKRQVSVRLRQRAAIIAMKNRSLSERGEAGTVYAMIRHGSIKNLARRSLFTWVLPSKIPALC